jgi:hypothetical protein
VFQESNFCVCRQTALLNLMFFILSSLSLFTSWFIYPSSVCFFRACFIFFFFSDCLIWRSD